MKLVVIGGGSSYTPELVEGVILHSRTLPVTEIVLIDVPMGEKKIQINTDFAKRMIAHAGLDISVRYTLDRKEGLAGAAFVITQLRVGGLDARAKDERIPLTYGVIGQETTGPGGFFKALRTIPGIVTEAVLKHTGIKCIGLCNVSINMWHDAAGRLGVPVEDMDCRFIGLNHLSVMNHAYCGGEDRIGDVLAVSNSESVVKNIEKNDEMDILAREMGCMFSPYLQYFYSEKEMLRKETKEALSIEGTRANQVKRVEAELFKCYQNESLKEKPEALAKRGGARYSEAAIKLIDSIYNDRKDVQVVDVQNHGTIPELPDDCVIETNCVIGKNGAEPLKDAEVPAEILGLVVQVKAYELLTIEAAIEGDRRKALLALMNNPLVHDVKDARGILEDMLEAHKEYLPRFGQ